jgi:hypothetical protein
MRSTNKIRYLLCSAKFEGTPIRRSRHAHTHVLCLCLSLGASLLMSPSRRFSAMSLSWRFSAMSLSRRVPFKECHTHTHVFCYVSLSALAFQGMPRTHTRSLLAFQGMPHTHVVSPYLTHAGGTARPQVGCLTQHLPS